MASARKWIFVLLLIAILYELLVFIPKKIHQSKTDEIKAVADDLNHEKSLIRGAGIHMLESIKGTRDWELFAESTQGTKGQGNWDLEKMKVQYYNKEKIDYTVTGNTGKFDSQTKDMEIKGDVITRSANGYEFQTSEVSYSALERLIQSPGDVVMVAPADEDGAGLRLTGKKMNVDVVTNTMVISENISAEKQLKSGKLKIKSQAAEFSGNNRRVKFLGNVVMKYNQFTIQGPEAILNYGASNSVLGIVDFKGGVLITDPDKSAKSETVQLDPKKGELILEGNPKVVQGEDELMGQRILFIENGKKIQIDNK